MKKKIFAGILILFVAVSAFAKSKKEPLIDFIVNIYNQKEFCSEQNIIEHGFIKYSDNKYKVTWNDLLLTINIEKRENRSVLTDFAFTSRDETAFLSGWQTLLEYIKTNYNAKYEPIAFFKQLGVSQPRFVFDKVQVINYYPEYYKFIITDN